LDKAVRLKKKNTADNGGAAIIVAEALGETARKTAKKSSPSSSKKG